MPTASGAPQQTSPVRVLVLGGAGFIGRHAAAALSAGGAVVTIGSRDPSRHRHALQFAQWLALRFERLLDAGAWAPLIQDFDVVVNCVGILRQRPRESYEDVHHLAPAALAQACAAKGIRFIHTSALGLHEGAKSRFLSSKLLGEKAIAASGSDYCILRPSLLDGVGGFGARWLRGLSQSPLQVIPRGARGSIAAMTATDLGRAYAALAAFSSLDRHREVELGGPHHFGYAEYLRELRTGYTTSKALQIPMPNWLTRLGAHACDLFQLFAVLLRSLDIAAT